MDSFYNSLAHPGLQTCFRKQFGLAHNHETVSKKKSDGEEHKKGDKQHTIHGTFLLPNGMTQEVTFRSYLSAESNCQNAASTNPTFLQYAAFIPSFINNLTS